MGQCPKCGERLEDGFDICWNCGTSRDGAEDPSFRKADHVAAEPGSDADARPPHAEPRQAAPHRHAAPRPRGIHCRDCAELLSPLGQIALMKRSDSAFLRFVAALSDRDAANRETFPVDVLRCPKCGRLELYDLDRSLPEAQR